MLTKRKREKESAMSKETQTEKEAATSITAQRIGLFTRQPLSTLGKIAFRGFLVATIAATGGAIALTLFAGGSRAIDIFAASLLAATILIVTGIRWLQVIAAVVGVSILYQFFTQPFVIESLANPKDASIGGYGHFIGDVVPMGLLIIDFVATLAMVWQNYHLLSRKNPSWFTPFLSTVTGIVVGALFIAALAPTPAPPAPATIAPLQAPQISAGPGVPTSINMAMANAPISVSQLQTPTTTAPFGHFPLTTPPLHLPPSSALPA